MEKKSAGAKKDVLKMLSKLMGDKMYSSLGDKMKSKQKVEVVADDEEGLEEGLSKAQELLSKYRETRGDSEQRLSPMEDEHDMEACPVCSKEPCECEVEYEEDEEQSE